MKRVQRVLLHVFSFYLVCGGRFIELPPPEPTPPPLIDNQVTTAVENQSKSTQAAIYPSKK